MPVLPQNILPFQMISSWTGIQIHDITDLLGTNWKQRTTNIRETTIPYLINFPIPTTIIQFRSPNLQMGDLLEAVIREAPLPRQERALIIGKAKGTWERNAIEWQPENPIVIPISQQSDPGSIFENMVHAYTNAHTSKLSECVECETCTTLLAPEHVYQGKFCFPCGLAQNSTVHKKKPRRFF